MIRRRLGELDCVMTGGDDDRGGGDGPTVVLLHGFGAGGDDLVALAEYVEAPAGTRWVFPAAPLALGGMYGNGRAWWMIDLEDLQRAASGKAGDRANQVPDGLPAARAAVLGVLDVLARDHGRTDAKTVLGGFSQGAMVTVDVALHAPAPLAGLAVLSGTLLAEEVWKARAAALAGVTILQTHGTRDQLLAFSAAERLRDFLLGAGAQVGFAPFPGGHEIPPPVLALFGDLLGRTLGVGVERYSLTTVDGLPGPPRYNIARGQDALVQTAAEVRAMRWGMLAPRRGHAGRRGPPIEVVTTATFAAIPMVRTAFEQRRCLVLADGFFAWRAAPGRKRARPYWVHPEPVRRVAFAGVWSLHHDDGRASFAIVIAPSAPPADAVADTMPLVVDDAWLGRLDDARALLAPRPLDGWRADAVSDWVDDPAHDDPRCTALLRNRAQGELF